MVAIGDKAPTFILPLAGGDGYDDVTEFSLSAAIGDGPIVLAFVPGAFTGGCTRELAAFHEQLDAFAARDASVYGVSVDLPFAQNVWIEREGYDLEMLSDWDHEAIKSYRVVMEDLYGSIRAAERSVFIIDNEGRIAFRWVRDGENPDFDELVEQVLSVLD